MVEGGKVSHLTRAATMRIESFDFVFANSPARIVALRDAPEIKLAGLTVGPFQEGNDYEVCHWIAVELARSGVARFHADDLLDASRMSKIQWTERVQTAGQISKLPDGFYPKLRRYLLELREGISGNPDRMREYERVDHLTRDILNSRLKKIVANASAPAQAESALRNLSVEEKLLYEQLFKTINTWKTKMLDHKEGA